MDPLAQVTSEPDGPNPKSSKRSSIGDWSSSNSSLNMKLAGHASNPVPVMPLSDAALEDDPVPSIHGHTIYHVVGDEEEPIRIGRTSLRSQNLAGKTTRAPYQMSETAQNTKLLEERIQVLETRVEALKKESNRDAPASTIPGNQSKTLTHKVWSDSFEGENLIAGINRVGETEYRKEDKKDSDKSHVIDVWVSLFNEAKSKEASIDSDHDSDADSLNSPRKEFVFATNPIPEDPVEESFPYPKRVRINSKPLLVELFTITDQIVDPSSKQFLPPFLLFTTFEQTIRDHTEELEHRYNREIQSASAITEEAGSIRKASETPVYNDATPTAIWTLSNRKLSSKGLDGNNHGEGLRQDVASRDVNKDSQNKANRMYMMEEDKEAVLTHEEDALEIMNICQVNKSQANRALAKHVNVASAVQAIQRSKDKRYASLKQVEVLLRQWKVLVRFLDEDLKATLRLRAELREGSATEIAFEDLSHLFRPGDLVVCSQDRSLQAMAVEATSGGRELLTDNLALDCTDPTAVMLGQDAPEWDSSLPSSGGYSPFIVDCFFYDSDGTNFGTISKSVVIHKYDFYRAISSLSVYPLMYYNRQISVATISEEKLRARGEKFTDFCADTGFSHKQYKGRTLDEIPEEVDSEVIIDYQMAALVPMDERPDRSRWMPILEIKPLTEADKREITEPRTAMGDRRGASEIFDDQKLNRRGYGSNLEVYYTYHDQHFKPDRLESGECGLLPPRVFGFVLKSRKWARLDIDKVKEVDNLGKGFDKLELPKGVRDLVEALVVTRLEGQPQYTQFQNRHEVDIVPGKGRGLVILLHGAPGVGKTSTAESIAEHTGKPLFPITCGDVGETAREVEKNLNRWFSLAQRWGCVLLLDEADVFLAKRDKTDVKRNALVSVFLRVLEYYTGVLFLTTNRVGTIDDAFKSRVHMSLYYPELSPEQSQKIWEMNIRRTRENNAKLKIKKAEILKFAKRNYKKMQPTPWNGRQIRNAFQTAIALAIWEARPESGTENSDEPVKLSKGQFKKVEEASLQFEKYLRDTQGSRDEGQRAMDRSERAKADWSPSEDESTKTKQTSQDSGLKVRKSEKQQTQKRPEEEDENSDGSESG